MTSERLGSLYNTLERKLETLPEAGRGDVLKQMATLATDKLRRPEDASELLRLAVELNPDDGPTWDTQKILKRHGDMLP